MWVESIECIGDFRHNLCCDFNHAMLTGLNISNSVPAVSFSIHIVQNLTDVNRKWRQHLMRDNIFRIQFVFNPNCCFKTTKLLLIKCTQTPVFVFQVITAPKLQDNSSEMHDTKPQHLTSVLTCIFKCANSSKQGTEFARRETPMFWNCPLIEQDK